MTPITISRGAWARAEPATRPIRSAAIRTESAGRRDPFMWRNSFLCGWTAMDGIEPAGSALIGATAGGILAQSRGAHSARPSGQLDEPELLVALDEPGAPAEEVGEQGEPGLVLGARPPLVHDGRAAVVEEDVVPDQQVGDAVGPDSVPDLVESGRRAHVAGEGIVLEDEVREVRPFQVIAVAAHVDEPHLGGRRQLPIDQLVVRIVVETPAKEVGAALAAQHDG